MRLFISLLLLVFSTSSWAQNPEDMRLKSELEYLNIESVRSAYTDFCKSKGLPMLPYNADALKDGSYIDDYNSFYDTI